eukprot:6206354-Pleurochrysis_carterae.AAC.2
MQSCKYLPSSKFLPAGVRSESKSSQNHCARRDETVYACVRESICSRDQAEAMCASLCLRACVRECACVRACVRVGGGKGSASERGVVAPGTRPSRGRTPRAPCRARRTR